MSNSRRLVVLRSRQALEEDLDGSAPFEAGELRLDVGQHANLRRRSGPLPDRIEQPQQPVDVFHRVDGRIDADERVARAEGQAPVTKKGNSLRIVGGMIRLQARRERAGQSEQGARPRGMADLPGDQNQLVDVAQLGQGRGHHARQGPADALDLAAGRRQQAVLQLAQRQRGNRREDLAVDVVIDAHHAVDAPLVVGQGTLVEVLRASVPRGRCARPRAGLRREPPGRPGDRPPCCSRRPPAVA